MNCLRIPYPSDIILLFVIKTLEVVVKDSFSVMTEAEEIIDKALMPRIEEGILLDPNPEDIIFKEAPITGSTITNIK